MPNQQNSLDSLIAHEIDFAEKLIRKILASHTKAIKEKAIKEERENHKSVLDDDSCECDNCHRTRRYFKNPKKELHKVKQRKDAVLQSLNKQ